MEGVGGSLSCWRFAIGTYFGKREKLMAARPVVESRDTQWLTTSASLAVGASFFALWFWLLPSWLGFDVAAVGGARWRWIGVVPSVLGFPWRCDVSGISDGRAVGHRRRLFLHSGWWWSDFTGT